MNHQKNSNSSRLEALSLLAIRYARELGEALTPITDLPLEDLPSAAVSGLLRRLQTGDVTDERDIATLEVLQRGCMEQACREIAGSRIEPRRVGHDQEGDIWGMFEVPTYTERGDKFSQILEHIDRFLEIRQRLLDSAKAERLTKRLSR